MFPLFEQYIPAKKHINMESTYISGRLRMNTPGVLWFILASNITHVSNGLIGDIKGWHLK